MLKKLIALVMVCSLVWQFSGCITLMPRSGPTAWGKASIKRDAMARYLEENELNTSYILASALGQVAKGQRFRERVNDQKGRMTLATIWIDVSEPDILHVQTMRDGPCPHCNGTGVGKGLGLNLSVDFMCRHCKGSGIIENLVTEKRYILTNPELDSPIVGRPSAANNRFAHMQQDVKPLSAEEQKYIKTIASKTPQERLEALKWLDTYYVKLGVFFTRLEPMLRKAIWQETDERTNIRIYQFKAGDQTIPEKAYYRLFVDMDKGTIIRKTFVSFEDSRKNPYAGTEGLGGKLNNQVEGVKNWFTEGF